MKDDFTAYVADVFGVNPAEAVVRVDADMPEWLVVDCFTAEARERILEQDVPAIAAAALSFGFTDIDLRHQGQSKYRLPIGLCLSPPKWVVPTG